MSGQTWKLNRRLCASRFWAATDALAVPLPGGLGHRSDGIEGRAADLDYNLLVVEDGFSGLRAVTITSVPKDDRSCVVALVMPPVMPVITIRFSVKS